MVILREKNESSDYPLMTEKKQWALCFGEVLYDLFPSEALPGGAPLNVAAHLQNLGFQSSIISRVGADRLGDELLQFLKEKGVDASYVQRDGNYPTGTVRVNIEKSDDPEYTIVEKVAWDYIEDSFLTQELHPTYIIHGSLICRSAESSASLKKLISATQAKVVFDLNIRSPYYSKSVIDGLMQTAHIVKMNMEEFKMLKEWFYIKNPKEKGDMRALKALYPNLETIILTKGGKGATAWQEGKMESVGVFPVEVMDTVGSGDAFLAAFLATHSTGASLKESLTYASATASLVAGENGANPLYKEADVLKLMEQ